MKLCKKKMAILVTVLCLIVVMVFVLCSFNRPSYSSAAVTFSGLNSYEVDGLISVALLQYDVGAFNSLCPICIAFDGRNVVIYFGSLPYGSGYAARVSSTGNLVVSGISNTSSYYMYFCEGGFSFFSRSAVPSFDYSIVLGYWPSYGSDFVRNENFSFSSATDPNSDYIVDAVDYWIDYQYLLDNDPAEAESIYNHGYTDGYLTGNADGYRNGYDEGVDYGYNVGYPAGYDSGLADGYESGYDKGYETGYDNGYYQGDIDGYESGYDEGYSEGYSEGYEEADRETVTVIEYVEPVEISVGSIISGISSVPDNILNGTFDFELFGINVYGLLKVIIILFVISAVVVFVIKRSA